MAVYILLLPACGSDDPSSELDVSIPTQSTPYVHRVEPAQGAPGDIIAIYGFGFSIEAGNNIVSVGGASALATDYTALGNPSEGEIESLIFNVPVNAPAGLNLIYVTVFGNTSNANVTFTVLE